jgi:hypothetical protein
LNVAALSHVYDYLCELPPFDRWSLPPSDEIKFRITKSKKKFAQYWIEGGIHHIDVSAKLVGSHIVILSTIAHELIHLHLEEVDACDEHGPNFQVLADVVCQVHGFDRLTF